MNHTPGPWHISKSGQYVRKNGGLDWPAWNVCEINQNHDRAEADARLIAAAPDLLVACEAALAAIGDDMDSEDPPHPDIARAYNLLMQAIAKARG